MNPANLDILFTNIGRGHPFYLDGIIEVLSIREQANCVSSQRDVFDISTGLSLAAWRLARWLYRRGSSPGMVGSVYRRIRSENDYNRPGAMLNLMAAHLRRKYADDSNQLIVAHPILVACLRGRTNLVYQHGELVTPSEAVVHGAEKILVPTDDAARPFIQVGYSPDDVIVSGLFIEPALVNLAADAYDARLKRLASNQPLTGAFFSSGAEPKHHVEQIVAAVGSVIRCGGKAIIFAQCGGRLARAIREGLAKDSVQLSEIGSGDSFPAKPESAVLVCYSNRREIDVLTAGSFEQFDYLVSPSHERTNWAVGLGLPMFVIGPPIGPFAPLNRDLLLRTQVACELDSAYRACDLGDIVASLRAESELAAMAARGWQRYPIDGFGKAVDFLLNN
ncbi:MAG: hypothetical protein KAT79_05965 [candidate division Zixibacteria bacterium]|nr:hypothetical protein [candidate division Zixibacteria bacterium]